MRLTLDSGYFRALSQHPVSRMTLALLAHVLDHADGNGVFREPRDSIATRLGIHPEMVTQHLTRLVRAGLVRRIGRPAETLAVVINTEVRDG